eukprot:4125369-Pleurochrysis_carterae.AAC.1
MPPYGQRASLVDAARTADACDGPRTSPHATRTLGGGHGAGSCCAHPRPDPPRSSNRTDSTSRRLLPRAPAA